MATIGIGLVLLFIIDYAVSGHQSGILSNLYKKSVEEKRPMVVVIKKDNEETAIRDVDQYSMSLGYSQKKYDPTLKKPYSHRDSSLKQSPLSFLQNLGSQHYHINNKQSHAHDHSNEVSKPRYQTRAKTRSRPRLLSQSNRNSRDDRRDVDDRRDRDRRIQNRNNRVRRDRNRDNRDRRDRNRDDRDRRESDRNDRDMRDYDRNSRDRYDRDRRERDRRDRDRYDRDRRDRDGNDSDKRVRDLDREYTDRRDRDRYENDRDGYDNDRLDRDRRDRDRDDSDRHDRDRYFSDETRYENENVDRTLRALIKNTLKEKGPQEKASDDPTTRALRSSIVQNLLRAANDLNCQAKDECQDECGGKKEDACEDKCEKEFTCEEEKKDHGCGDGGDCDQEDECGQGNDSCGGDGNDNVSTRGVPYEEVTVKCKRC